MIIYNRCRNVFQLLLVLTVVFLTPSCVKYSNLTSYKSGEADHIIYNIDTTLQYKLMKGDKIHVQVVNNTGEEVDIFNKQVATAPQGGGANTFQLQGYDIDSKGFVDIPMIGKVYAEGKSIFQLDSIIEVQLKDYITFAYVKTVLLSYRITMIGEFRMPQTFNNTFPEINIIQAIGTAGDFTDVADRKKIKVYRKNNRGVYEMYVLNLSNDKIFNKTQFNLQPNDIVYAQPLKAKALKVNAPTISIVISIITLTLVLMGYTKII